MIPASSFKVTPFFDAEYLRNSTRYRHRFNEILIGTYTRPTQQCYFEWPWVFLSDLGKYSMTRSAARSLCDSWASCITVFRWRLDTTAYVWYDCRWCYRRIKRRSEVLFDRQCAGWTAPDVVCHQPYHLLGVVRISRRSDESQVDHNWRSSSLVQHYGGFFARWFTGWLSDTLASLWLAV